MKEKTKLYVITDDNALHKFEIIDNTLTDQNVCWEVIEKLERLLDHNIMDYWITKEYKQKAFPSNFPPCEAHERSE